MRQTMIAKLALFLLAVGAAAPQADANDGVCRIPEDPTQAAERILARELPERPVQVPATIKNVVDHAGNPRRAVELTLDGKPVTVRPGDTLRLQVPSGAPNEGEWINYSVDSIRPGADPVVIESGGRLIKIDRGRITEVQPGNLSDAVRPVHQIRVEVRAREAVHLPTTSPTQRSGSIAGMPAEDAGKPHLVTVRDASGKSHRIQGRWKGQVFEGGDGTRIDLAKPGDAARLVESRPISMESAADVRISPPGSAQRAAQVARLQQEVRSLPPGTHVDLDFSEPLSGLKSLNDIEYLGTDGNALLVRSRLDGSTLRIDAGAISRFRSNGARLDSVVYR
jgi:hypothetical protein